MYNRILKRPMFKRGGPSYQAQGTGITSPFDTPRRQYNVGTSWEEIQENIRKSTADNTTTMQDVAQGFSYLGSPYKDDGSAKTIGEMIFEGSQAVSGARGERAKTAQAGELAAQEVGVEKLKSDIAISEAEKERAKDIKLAQIGARSTLDNLPRDRQIENFEKIWTDDKNNQPGGMSEFESTFSTRIPTAIVDARMHNSKTRNDPDFVQAEVAPESAYTLTDAGWALDTSKLTKDRVWFDVTTGSWFFIDDAGSRIADISITSVVNKFKANKKGIPVASEGESVGDNAGTIKTTESGEVDAEGNLKKKVNYSETGDPTVEDFFPTKSSPDMIETAIATADQTGKDITDFWKWVSEPKRGKKDQVVKKADGGRIGYMDGSDPEATELDMLNNWWRKQLATNWNE